MEDELEAAKACRKNASNVCSSTVHIVAHIAPAPPPGDSSGASVQFALMTPAVTPWFSSLDGAGANNPAFRLYFTDDNGVINDFETYYINLTTLNNDGSKTKFVKEYSFKESTM
ncbi:hypothetical protein OSTOST_21995 [Ostertagia ostertagi]